MTCGINLGILLICLLQAVHVCCSWALHEGSQIQSANTYASLSHVHSRPQDEFRQAHAVQSHPTNTEANSAFSQGLPNRQPTHTASGFQPSSYPSYQYFKSSLANPKWRTVDSTGNVPQKKAFSVSSSIAGGSSLSKHDSSDKHRGIGRPWPPQQGTRPTSQYASGQSYFQSPSRGSYSFPSGPKQPVDRKPHSAAKAQKELSSEMGVQLTDPSGSVKNPLQEFVQKPTSAFARGRRVNQKGGSRKPWSPQSGHQSKPGLPLTGTGSAPVWHRKSDSSSGRLGPGQRLAPTKTHEIPQHFGGYAIKRLTDEESDEPMKTPRPVQTYTFPPRQTESLMPWRPKVHHKSKWMRIRSNQLMGGAGALG